MTIKSSPVPEVGFVKAIIPKHRLCQCEPTCFAAIEDFVCTRKYGHSGPHISCAIRTHNARSWPQTSPVAKPTKEDVEKMAKELREVGIKGINAPWTPWKNLSMVQIGAWLKLATHILAHFERRK